MSTQTVTAAELASATIKATAQSAPIPAAPAAPTEERDALGRLWDSLKFKKEKDTQGRWKNLRGGRPKKDAGPQASYPHPQDRQGVPPPGGLGSFVAPDAAAPVAAKVSEMTAETCIGLIQTALVVIGEDEGVLSDQEKLLLRAPLLRVLAKYDVGDMPAELDLAVAIAVIVIARLRKPKTATFFAKARAWWINLWFRREGKRLAASVAQHAPTAEEKTAA